LSHIEPKSRDIGTSHHTSIIRVLISNDMSLVFDENLAAGEWNLGLQIIRARIRANRKVQNRRSTVSPNHSTVSWVIGG